ncbi:MAG: hypothetical protein RIC49_12780 [Phycisphaerales bacterium]
MIDWILAGIALALGGGAESGEASTGVADPAGVSAGGAATAFAPEPQVPTGQFTTAVEVKPILQATKGNWVAVREYEGQDLVYVTHLLSWRCGMHQLRYAINDGAMQVWPMPPCLTATAQPNAIRTEDGLPYQVFGLGQVQSVSVEILFDDLTTDSARFERAQVLMP